MTVPFIILQTAFLLIMIVLMIQLLRAKNAFRSMLIKFVNINQVFYENQKLIVGKFSNLIISLDRAITEERDTLQKNKIDFDSQTQTIKDCLTKILMVNKKVESYSSAVGKLYEQLKRPPAQPEKTDLKNKY
jgi:hypothetical protein